MGGGWGPGGPGPVRLGWRVTAGAPPGTVPAAAAVGGWGGGRPWCSGGAPGGGCGWRTAGPARAGWGLLRRRGGRDEAAGRDGCRLVCHQRVGALLVAQILAEHPDAEARDEPAHRRPGLGEPAAIAGLEKGKGPRGGDVPRLALPNVFGLAPLEKDAGTGDCAHPGRRVVPVELNGVEVFLSLLGLGTGERAPLAEETDQLGVGQQLVLSAEDWPEEEARPRRQRVEVRPDARRVAVS